jgi:hypothetical protein
LGDLILRLPVEKCRIVCFYQYFAVDPGCFVSPTAVIPMVAQLLLSAQVK